MTEKFDIGIIGAGPGGYSAAIRASQRGKSVVLFEKDCAGGVCLNRGCIPTKAVLHCTDFYKNLKKAEKFGITIENAAFSWEKIFERKNTLTQKIQNNLRKLILSHDVTIVDEEAALISEKIISAGEKEYQCENIIIATGTKPAQIKGLDTDGRFIVNSDELLQLKSIPDNILIIGSGAIGIEWARIFSGLGKNVTVVEIAPSLFPPADADISTRIERIFKKDKIKFFKSTSVQKIENNQVFLDNGTTIDTELVLVAAGRTPVLPETANIKLKMNGKFLEVNENFQTSIENIYAIGDVNGKIQLAHAATHQAISVVDFITRKYPIHFDAIKIPSVIYGNPEIACVGKTEKMLEGEDYRVSCFPVAALGKAQADDEIDGFIKVISVKNRIVGAHVVAPEASSLVQQFALMIDNEIPTEKILETTFAHPTYSEGVFEAVLGLENLSLSLPKVKL